MEVKACTPNLMVKDIDNTLAYYTQILGFEVKQCLPEKGPAVWALVKFGKAEFMFQSEESLKGEFEELKGSKTGGALTFFIQVEDTRVWYEKLKGNVKLIKPYGLTAYNGANEFVMMDPNGYILHFSDIRFD